MPLTPDQLLEYLAELDIAAATVDHEPVFTVDEARRLRSSLPGGHSKSLFLRNKKGAMWLVVTLADTRVDLKHLGETIGSGRLSFASPERLMQHLGVIPGAVTPFALANDTNGEVCVALEGALLDHDPLHFHPLDNAKTTSVGPQDLLRFLEATGHAPRILEPADL